MKLPRTFPPGFVRIWFWNQAGAQSTVVSADRAVEMRKYLIAGGSVVWHSELYR